MTHPMTDERLDELRKLANLTDQEDHWRALHNETALDGVTIGDFRSLLARLDAAEELLREVARSAVAFNFTRDNEILNAVEIDQDVLRKCRSYLR